jgi:ribosome assembly protein YihI (activator of Der GTPase)
MNKLEEIKNQLASRLEKQAKTSLQSKQAESKIIQPEVAKSKIVKLQEPAKLNNSLNQNGAVKLSVSLYNFDITCLDKIKDYMRKQGIRKLSDSEALRLACRAVETNNNFLGIYESMQTEDRRRKRI